jgi:hypothetical protein
MARAFSSVRSPTAWMTKGAGCAKIGIAHFRIAFPAFSLIVYVNVTRIDPRCGMRFKAYSRGILPA